MKTPLLAITTFFSTFLLLCALPSDPAKDPDNAKVTFTTIDGEQPVSPAGGCFNCQERHGQHVYE